MRATRFMRAITPLALVAGWLIAAPATSAHTAVHVGEYDLEIGWGAEPTFVGVPNFVELSIADAAGNPVTDLKRGDITVVVSTAGQSTEPMLIEPRFVVGEFGEAGLYGADILPTVPGDYTFTFAGTLNGETVDVMLTSGEDTFSPIQASTDVEFPVKVPTMAEVAQRLERIDSRIQDAAAGAQASADAAVDAANRATQLGVGIGGLGLVVAVVALAVAWRATRTGAGPG